MPCPAWHSAAQLARRTASARTVQRRGDVFPSHRKAQGLAHDEQGVRVGEVFSDGRDGYGVDAVRQARHPRRYEKERQVMELHQPHEDGVVTAQRSAAVSPASAHA